MICSLVARITNQKQQRKWATLALYKICPRKQCYHNTHTNPEVCIDSVPGNQNWKANYISVFTIVQQMFIHLPLVKSDIGGTQFQRQALSRRTSIGPRIRTAHKHLEGLRSNSSFGGWGRASSRELQWLGQRNVGGSLTGTRTVPDASFPCLAPPWVCPAPGGKVCCPPSLMWADGRKATKVQLKSLFTCRISFEFPGETNGRGAL